jgi:hypothetical protein
MNEITQFCGFIRELFRVNAALDAYWPLTIGHLPPGDEVPG